jgi:hypothetical protein
MLNASKASCAASTQAAIKMSARRRAGTSFSKIMERKAEAPC